MVPKKVKKIIRETPQFGVGSGDFVVEKRFVSFFVTLTPLCGMVHYTT